MRAWPALHQSLDICFWDQGRQRGPKRPGAVVLVWLQDRLTCLAISMCLTGPFAGIYSEEHRLGIGDCELLRFCAFRGANEGACSTDCWRGVCNWGQGHIAFRSAASKSLALRGESTSKFAEASESCAHLARRPGWWQGLLSKSQPSMEGCILGADHAFNFFMVLAGGRPAWAFVLVHPVKLS